MKFTVTNPDGSDPDFAKIYREESWPMWDVGQTPSFVLREDGALALLASATMTFCSFTRCPPDRFTVQIKENNT